MTQTHPSTHPSTHQSDVLIMGAGPVGLALALAVARAGLSVRVIDRITADTLADPAFDGRASALASTSWQMLQNLGIADSLVARCLPDRSHRGQRRAEAGALDFDAGVDGMGVMMPNNLLRAALFEAASADADIELVMGAEVTSRVSRRSTART